MKDGTYIYDNLTLCAYEIIYKPLSYGDLHRYMAKNHVTVCLTNMCDWLTPKNQNGAILAAI